MEEKPNLRCTERASFQRILHLRVRARARGREADGRGQNPGRARAALPSQPYCPRRRVAAKGWRGNAARGAGLLVGGVYIASR